jgi:hypothetical protein
MTSNEIILDIRRHAAYIKSLILYLQNLHNWSQDQKDSIENLRLGFNLVSARYIAALRQAYGEPHYLEMEKVDWLIKDNSWGFVTKQIIELILEKVAEMQRTILLLPVENETRATNHESRVKSIDDLTQGLADWRNSDLGEFLNVFKVEI